MNDWQWFNDFEEEALARGDLERARLRQLHREAYDSSETDPDRALARLAEGRRLALALREPWWVLLFDHWHVHISLYDKSDYRHLLDPAVRNVLEVRKPQYRGFPQMSWILGDLIHLYLSLDPRGCADEIEQALAELEAGLTPQTDSARYLFMFHQLDAAANQDRSDDALQIGLAIRAAAQADPIPSTGDHFVVPCYRFLCHYHHLQHDWPEVATCAEAGTDLAQRLGQKQAIGVFQMWQAVVSRQRGAQDKASRMFCSATSRLARLKCPPERDYYDAECTYHELGGDWDKALHVRRRQIEDFTARGHLYDEFDARRAHLRLLVRLGQPLEPHLSAARTATAKFRRPECYLPQIERIAAKAEPLPGAESRNRGRDKIQSSTGSGSDDVETKDRLRDRHPCEEASRVGSEDRSYKMTKKKHTIPPGFVRCEVCGEFNGSTSWKNQHRYPFETETFEPAKMISVTCLCHGVLCAICGIHKVHRPCSNSYDEDTNTIEHWPYFTAQMPCRECSEKQEKKQAKKDTTEDRIYTALVDLLRDHKETAGIVLIKEPQSGKFVQFGPGWSLEMDVPHLTLNSEEADRAYKFFAKLCEDYLIEYNAPDPETGVVRHGATFNHDFGQDARAAARAALAFFQEIYLTPPDIQLTIDHGPAFS